MKINILVTGGLYDSQAAYSAWRFCKAALSVGHEISQIFFYQAGVLIGTDLAEPLSDEFDASSCLADLSAEHDVPLVVCVSAAERRGVLNLEQQTDLKKRANNMHPGYKIEGLGSFYLACLEADRLVTFK